MLRASPPLSVGQASHYYASEFSRGDYYTERESEGIVASRWHGRGAPELRKELVASATRSRPTGTAATGATGPWGSPASGTRP